MYACKSMKKGGKDLKNITIWFEDGITNFCEESMKIVKN